MSDRFARRSLGLALIGLLCVSSWPASAVAALNASHGPAQTGLPAAVPSAAATRVGTPIPAPGNAAASAPPLEPTSSISGQPTALAAPEADRGATPTQPTAPSASQQAEAAAEGAVGGVASGEASSQRKTLDPIFDGLKPLDGEPVIVEREDWARLVLHKIFTSPLGRRVWPTHFSTPWNEPPKPTADLKTTDDYRGPHPLRLAFWQRPLYGLKWGINLVGISSILHFALTRLVSILPWQLHMPGPALESIGRVEMLTQIGPAAIQHVLASAHPWHFLTRVVPLMTGVEELLYRGLYFLLGYVPQAAHHFLPTSAAFLFGFLPLIAAGPATAWISARLEKLRDPNGLLLVLARGVRMVGRLSPFAFPIAAVWSAHQFAVAHFAAWGVNPFYYVLHATLGFFLALVAYRSRSLSAPFVAHLTYNVLVIALMFLLPPSMTLLLSSLSIVFLFSTWIAHRHRLATARAQLKLEQKPRKGPPNGAALLLLAAMIGGSIWATSQAGPDRRAVAFLRPAAAVAQAQDPATPAPQTAPQAPTPPAVQPPQPADHAAPAAAVAPQPDLTEAQMRALLRPTVVKIIVRMPGGGGIGSGSIISPGGLVITNAHVAGPAGVGGLVQVELRLAQPAADGAETRTIPGRVVAVNADKDIALLQLPALQGGWPHLDLGDSDAVEELDPVLAVGYPLGLPQTYTHGIVSGKGGGRASIYVKWGQTDAAINHGNSGGPLVNSKGQVVGMNSWIASPQDAGSIGLGFWIVSNDMKAAVKQFVETGNIDSAWLGIIIDRSNPVPPAQGVLVEQVRPGSPAAKAGLRSGDILLGADGSFFKPGARNSMQSLAHLLALSKPGETHSFRISREGEVKDVTIVLGAKEPLKARDNAASQPQPRPEKPAQPTAPSAQPKP